MVDVKKIQRYLNKYFALDDEEPRIDPQTGVVDADGDVSLIAQPPQRKLPVQFGEVSGNFYCNGWRLKNLEGSPHTVHMDFDCQDIYLESLTGGPKTVGMSFLCADNRLQSLQGAPQKVSEDFICNENPIVNVTGKPQSLGGVFYIDWTAELPILSLLAYKELTLTGAPSKLQKIINKYVGTNNPGDILRCASELTEHGYEGNAEW